MIVEIPFFIDGKHIELTLSIGVASAKEVDGDQTRLIALADKRLYLAKQQGRNQVCAPDNDVRYSNGL
jgi:diguanylate cyclase (GGDEF)-like protein